MRKAPEDRRRLAQSRVSRERFCSKRKVFHGSSLAGAVVVGAHLDALHWIAYHTAMTHDETDNPQIDPLTVGELITLQEAAEYAGLTRDSIHGYIKRGRLKAKKKGWMWFTTQAAVDVYLQSRDLESIPKKYRNRT